MDKKKGTSLLIKKIPEGVRGCVDCGVTYQEVDFCGLTERCNKCSPIGLPTPEMAEIILPVMRKSNMSWKDLTTTMRRYKIRFEELHERLQAQQTRCGKCGEDVLGVFIVDHDHRCCPKVPTCGLCTRGLICSRCNLMLAGYDHYLAHKQETDEYIQKYEKMRKNKISTDLFS
jgi:hypothetical protein